MRMGARDEAHPKGTTMIAHAKDCTCFDCLVGPEGSKCPTPKCIASKGHPGQCPWGVRRMLGSLWRTTVDEVKAALRAKRGAR